jgi:hypothetical protein
VHTLVSRINYDDERIEELVEVFFYVENWKNTIINPRDLILPYTREEIDLIGDVMDFKIISISSKIRSRIDYKI